MGSGDGSLSMRVFAVIVLLLLSGFFSSAETAFTKASSVRMRTLAQDGVKKAELVKKLIEDPSRMLSAILIGNNIVNLSASALVTAVTMEIFGSALIGLATGVLTALILIFGEILPKTIATVYADEISLIYAPVIRGLIFVLTPLIFVANFVSSFIMRIIGIDPEKKQEVITEDDLRTIVEVSHEEGVLEKDEKTMITNVVDLGDTVARDVMIPRVSMVLVDIDTTYDELMDIIRRERYTRYPVYKENPDNIVGILNIKDIMFFEPGAGFSLKNYIRNPIFTYENKKISELLPELRRRLSSMVIVLDEYGETAGMVTMEDILEEIVGEIRDEYDGDEADGITRVKSVENSWIIDGLTRLDDINTRLGTELKSEMYDTIAGYLLEHFGHLPKTGETVEVSGIRFKVEKLDKNRISRVCASFIPEEEQEKKDKEKE